MGKYKPTTDRKPVFMQQKLEEARGIAEATAISSCQSTGQRCIHTL
jgi:hypothetical protein